MFLLATKPDMRPLHYEVVNLRLETTPLYNGLPTIFDGFCVIPLMHMKGRGEKFGKGMGGER